VALAILAVTLCVLLPLAFAVGVAVTFRVAGPIYRFEQHLRVVAEGRDPGPCKIRKGDELQDFCDVLNAALGRMRQSGAFSNPDDARHDAGQTADPRERREAA
jgi:hypothetical protein